MTPCPLRLGLIGLDTSHVEDFAALLNEPASVEHIPGARIVAGFPGGSPDFPLSANRIEGYTRKLQSNFGVEIVDTLQALALRVDAVLLTSVDGRIHLAQFAEIAPFKLPVYVNKPFATNSRDARAIVDLAAMHRTPIWSSSSLRFASELQAAVRDDSSGEVIGADFYGPLPQESTQPGWFWYGIHIVEMLYTAMGPGCATVRLISSDKHEVVVGTWRDGRLGVARGYRGGRHGFGGTIHRLRRTGLVDASVGPRPEIGLTQAILAFGRGSTAPVTMHETLEIVRFVEAANTSRATNGAVVAL